MDGGDRGLHLEGPRLPLCERVVEERDRGRDGGAVPAGAVLVGEGDGRAARVEAGRAAGVVQQDEREEPAHLGGLGRHLGERPGQAHGERAEVGADGASSSPDQ